MIIIVLVVAIGFKDIMKLVGGTIETLKDKNLI